MERVDPGQTDGARRLWAGGGMATPGLGVCRRSGLGATPGLVVYTVATPGLGV